MSAGHRVALAALFAAGICITYARDPNLFRYPLAAYEDGRDMFGFFYNHPEPGSILRFYNGYVSLIPNAAGYLAARAPVTAIPHLLSLFPLLVAALAFAWPARPAFREVVESDRLRWVACLTLALAPLGNYLFVSSTTYSVWNLLFLLILMSLAGAPEKPGAAAGRWAAMAALIWSHPLSIALVPVWLGQAWLRRGLGRLPGLFYGALTVTALAYQALGVEHGGDRAVDLAWIGRVTGILVLERVFFNTLLSDRLSRALHNRGEELWVYLIAAAVVATLAAVAIALRRRLGARRLWHLAVLAYLIVALTALYVIGRSGDLSILTGNPGYRYFWVQRLCFILLIFVLVEPLLKAWAGRPARAAATALALLLAVDLWWLNRMDNSKYRGRPGQGAKLAAFTANVAEQERTGDGSVSARLQRGAWSIELERAAAPDP